MTKSETEAKTRPSEECICCGAYVSEGHWLCPNCERASKDDTKKLIDLINREGDKLPNNHRR